MPTRVDARTAVQRLRRFVPPVLDELVARSRSGWRYVGRSWPSSYQRGWHDQSVAEAQTRHWPFLVDATAGHGPLGVSHFPWRTTADEPADQNVVASFGYVLALTALAAGGPISLLDWGGGLGHYRLYARALLPRVPIDYHCFDLPGIVAAGRTRQPDANFHTSESEIGARSTWLYVAAPFITRRTGLPRWRCSRRPRNVFCTSPGCRPSSAPRRSSSSRRRTSISDRT